MIRRVIAAGTSSSAQRGRWEPLDRLMLALIVLTLPWEFTKRFFPVDWLELSRVVMVVAIGWLVMGAVRRRQRPRLEPRGLVLAVGALLAVELASYALTRWPNGPREIAVVLAYAALAAFVASVLRRRSDFRSIALIFIASGVIVAGLGIAEQLGEFYLWKDHPLEVLGRRNSTFADPNITARFLVLALVATLGLAATWRPPRRSMWIVLLIVVGIIEAGLVFTLSRSGWLIGLLALALWVPVALARRGAGLAMLVALATFVIVVLASPNAVRRAADVPEAGDPLPASTAPLARPAVTHLDALILRIPLDEVRRYLLRAGLAMFEDHPLTGLGLGGFQPELIGPYRNFIPADRQSRVTSLQHIEIIRIASEMGVVGLAALITMLAAAWWGLWRSARGSPWFDRVLAYGLASILLVIVLSSQSEGRFTTEPYLWLVIGGIAAFLRRGPDWAPLTIPDGSG